LIDYGTVQLSQQFKEAHVQAKDVNVATWEELYTSRQDTPTGHLVKQFLSLCIKVTTN
jgi:hypothetical protein